METAIITEKDISRERVVANRLIVEWIDEQNRPIGNITYAREKTCAGCACNVGGSCSKWLNLNTNENRHVTDKTLACEEYIESESNKRRRTR